MEKYPYNPSVHHRRSIRLKGYDYSRAGLYFVTICLQNKQCLFGKITEGEMVLNDVGEIAFDEWKKTSDIRSNVLLDVFVIMPNHIHGIIVIVENDDNHGRGELHSPDKMNELHSPDIETGVCDKGVCDTPLRSPSNTVGAIVRGYKSAVTKQLGYSIWQRNYYEHIIRNENAYQNIFDYIVNNPANWNEDEFYTE